VHRRRIQTAIATGVTSADLVAAPGPGLKIYVVSFILTAGASANTVKFTSGTVPTDITATHHLGASGSLAVGAGDEARLLETDRENEKLSIVATGGPVDVTLRYYTSVS
jgi:hypothetical protein